MTSSAISGTMTSGDRYNTHSQPANAENTNHPQQDTEGNNDPIADRTYPTGSHYELQNCGPRVTWTTDVQLLCTVGARIGASQFSSWTKLDRSKSARNPTTEATLKCSTSCAARALICLRTPNHCYQRAGVCLPDKEEYRRRGTSIRTRRCGQKPSWRVVAIPKS